MIKMRYNTSKKINIVSCLMKIAALCFCFFLISCKQNGNPAPAQVASDCIVTDKAKLESITIFPASNLLNQDISSLTVDTRSAGIISFLGTTGLHADFGSGLYNGVPIGIPFILVCGTQQKIPILFRANSYDGNYGSESDAGPYPIPLSAPIEGNGTGDSHVLAVDIDNKVLYELYNASVTSGKWGASAGSVWDLKTNVTRPAGWTSCDAAGLPILPCLVRYEEVLKGTIDHAIRFTLSKAKVMTGYTAPANHKVTGSNTNAAIPTPMGLRLRLKASISLSGYSAANQAILTAMKKYGIILADIGSDFFISGAPDERWDNNDLQQLKNIKASDFEVVPIGTIL
jgi:hypothetical protein